MIAWLWLVALPASAEDLRSPAPRERAAVRALSLARGRDGMVATAEEQDEAYQAACQLGWRAACNPAAWSPRCANPVDDPIMDCLAAGWDATTPERATTALEPLCTDGHARACYDLAAVVTDPQRGSELIDAACAAGVGVACREGDPARACDLGDGVACQAISDGDRACVLGVAAACTERAMAQGGVESGGREVATLYRRGCALGDAAGCSGLGQLLAVGRGIPQDSEEASRQLIRACEGAQGDACRVLAGRILNDQAEGIAMAPRALYARACELGDTEGCRRSRRFDLEQRRSLTKLVAGGFASFFLWPNIRPFLGGSIGGVGRLALPKVDAVTSRRSLRLAFEAGAADYTFDLQNPRGISQNQSMVALDWLQQGDPWGLRFGAAGVFWQGAPDFADAAPDAVYNVNGFVPRIDVSHERLLGPHTGLALSLSGLWGEEQQNDVSVATNHGRVTMSVRRDTTVDVLAMAGARSEFSGWVGRSFTDEETSAGVVLTDVRSWPIRREPSGRVSLAVVTDGWASLRAGEVPRWLRHHAAPRLGTNVGSWTLLRGFPAASLSGPGLFRGHVALRWAIVEYHGRPQPIELYVAPWVEAAAVLAPSFEGVDGYMDAGASVGVVWNRSVSIRTDVMYVPESMFAPAAGRVTLVLEQTVDPWR